MKNVTRELCPGPDCAALPKSFEASWIAALLWWGFDGTPHMSVDSDKSAVAAYDKGGNTDQRIS